MKYGDIIITSQDSVKVDLSTDGTVWMNKQEIAALFHVKQAAVESSLKILLQCNYLWQNIFMKEINGNIDGKQCRIELFNLDVIIAVYNIYRFDLIFTYLQRFKRN